MTMLTTCFHLEKKKKKKLQRDLGSLLNIQRFHSFMTWHNYKQGKTTFFTFINNTKKLKHMNLRTKYIHKHFFFLLTQYGDLQSYVINCYGCSEMRPSVQPHLTQNPDLPISASQGWDCQHAPLCYNYTLGIIE